MALQSVPNSLMITRV